MATQGTAHIGSYPNGYPSKSPERRLAHDCSELNLYQTLALTDTRASPRPKSGPTLTTKANTKAPPKDESPPDN